jgi:hypothetical protein
MGGPHADRGEARSHGAARPLTPRHRSPRRRGQSLRQCFHADGAMTSRAAQQRGRSAEAAILPRGQRRAARAPHARLGANSHGVGQTLGRQRIAKRGHDAVAGIGCQRSWAFGP